MFRINGRAFVSNTRGEVTVVIAMEGKIADIRDAATSPDACSRESGNDHLENRLRLEIASMEAGLSRSGDSSVKTYKNVT